ncbi:MAG: hypothetical protein ABIK31_03295 [candidate division WOR-3 bacterium]
MDFRLEDIDETPLDRFNKSIISAFNFHDFLDMNDSLGELRSLGGGVTKKDIVLASVLDPQREELPSDVWNLSVNPPVLSDVYREEVLDRLSYFLGRVFHKPGFDYVVGIYIISSIGTYHYNDYTDFDVKVVIDFNKFFNKFPKLSKFDSEDVIDFLIREAREDYEMYKPISRAGVDLNQRNFDWYFFIEQNFNRNLLNSSYKFDSVYDVLNGVWLKEPVKRSKEDDAAVLRYAINIASRLFESFDEKFGRLRRNSLLYLELEEYLRKISPDSIDIQGQLVDVLYEIGKDLNLLYRDKEYLKMLRDKSVGENEMINIFSKKFKSSNYNDGNLVRKILEKFGYWLVLVKLSSLAVKHPEVNREVVEQIRDILSDYDLV